ncbi:hypothetical protein Syn33_080 [Prochlorococcus phage Syn33]|uniref:Uncharacterized protein n=2 Tax=Brizovirus syn33 TaxID=2734097 RepID=E3SQW7_9CAUD|nr:hypothetical protein Syn33_080 [Prochlorococcus phage Syn33]ADO99703.1 hypothetical protein Syn33_080 [Prochlorococcus phage Syn33]
MTIGQLYPILGFTVAPPPKTATIQTSGKRNCLNLFSLIMRKIESQMCAAIQANQDFKSGNTQVITIEGVSFIYLHGNQIASVDEDSMTIYDGGWQSTTTKSRLNALCDYFCVAGEGVFQKNYKWFVRKFTAQLGTEKVFTTEEFTNGYIFA